MSDAPAEALRGVLLESGDPDLDPVWGLLEGSAECDDHACKYMLPVSDVERALPAECAFAVASPEWEDVNESANQKELTLSIISFGPWRRVGRFPFALSSCNEASIPCFTPLTVGDALRAQLYDEEGKELCDTDSVALTDEDWACLNYASVGSEDSQSSRLLSCIKDCGQGWSVCFDMKKLPEENSVSHVLRFVRVAKSCVTLPQSCKQELCQSSTDPSSSDVSGCLDCTDADAYNETAIASSRMLLGMRTRSSMHDVLHRLALLDEADLPARLLQPGFWTSMSRGASLQGKIQRGRIDINKHDLEQASVAFQQSGFSTLKGLAWEQVGISLDVVAATMQSLSHHGFPPVFVFMYDEPWLLFEQLFKGVASILGSNNVEMDTAVFAWALRPAGEHGAVGSNFSRPHRDCSYDACHTQSGNPSALSLWMPLVHVTTDSGCMYVVPSEHDPLFDKSKDSRHMCPDQQMPWAYIRPLPCSAGDVIMWQGNLIHWGGACSKNVLQPRKSLGTSFRLPDESYSQAGKSDTVSKAMIEAGLSPQARLKIIISSLLGYEQWHPGFKGFSGFNDLFGCA